MTKIDDLIAAFLDFLPFGGKEAVEADYAQQALGDKRDD